MAHFVLVPFLIFCIITANSANNCGQIFENKVTDEVKKIIVDKHNELRNLISEGKVPGQPKGINLKKIEWDSKLGEEAQKISNTCKFGHVGVHDDRFYVGQNIAAWRGTFHSNGPYFENFIEAWFSEHKNFIYPNISHGTTGHYTQVVWADTQYVGCGYTHYRKSPSDWYDKLYVCNYGPGGNYVGAPPYKV